MANWRTCTAAFYDQGPDGRQRLAGAGVGIGIARRHFVLSAGSLLARVATGLWIGDLTRTLQVQGAATLGDRPDARAELRSLNMGFAPLQSHEVHHLMGLDFLPADDVDLVDDPPRADYVAIAPDASGPGEAAWQTLPAREVSADDYWTSGVHPATHIVVRVEAGASSAGLIGSGVWRQARDPTRRLLTGIVVALSTDEGGLRLVATRPAFMLLGIGQFLGMGPWSRPRPDRMPRGRPVQRPH